MLLFKPRINLPREGGRTILFDVITENNIELIKVLINAGADLNILDDENNSPLSYMIDEGLLITNQKDKEHFLERLVFVLKFRIDVNTIDSEGRTIFHKAVFADDLDVVEKLLTKKTNLDIKDKQGRTALHHTQWKGNYKIARLLIAAGADINEPDYAGFTILNYAAILGHTKLVVVLILSGVLMYNHSKKSKTVAQFFKEREANLNTLLNANITDGKMRRAIEEVIENLKKEINETLEGTTTTWTKKKSIIILAAGAGTRMKSTTPKVLHKISGKPMLYYSIKEALTLSDDITVVLFHQASRVQEEMEKYFSNITYVIQDHEKYPGTGGAVMGIKPKYEQVLVLNGDMPLIQASELEKFDTSSDTTIVMSVLELESAEGYGRVIIEKESVRKIVEQKDANENELKVTTANAGIYQFQTKFLLENLPKLSNLNAQKEYYITDLVEMAINQGKVLKPLVVSEENFKRCKLKKLN